MHSLATAARLLDNALSPSGLATLLAELGFNAPITMSPQEAGSVGLPEDAGSFSIAAGVGAMRVVGFEVENSCEMRPHISRIATRLVSRSPHLLWVIAALDCRRGEVAIAACEARKSGARVVALVARPGHIVDSDSETVCALAAAAGESDLLVHARWLEILGRESVSRRFFQALERSVSNLARELSPHPGATDAAELALLCTSRLLFLSFLETKGWLNRDHGFLGNQYADRMMKGGGYHRRVLIPLFFGTLNTHPRNRAARAQAFGRIPFLNGGLFARSALERRHSESVFPDEALGNLFADVLTRYRFTAREDTTLWSEAAVDPEMLGKAFESLMSASTRKRSGAFYTPQSLVVQLSRSALSASLSSPLVSEAEHTLSRLETFRLLDPACGSGAFLVHALEEISSVRRQLGDPRPLHDIRRAVLTNSIFGVDVNPTAVWLCELRLWLCMAIENPERDPMRVPPLPNLDRHIRVGDSLLADSFGDVTKAGTQRSFSGLRDRYSRATGPRKRSLGRLLDRAERLCAIDVLETTVRTIQRDRKEVLISLRGKDLFGIRTSVGAGAKTRLKDLRQQLRSAQRDLRLISSGGALPFSFATHFADAAANGGFDVVVGNPPWVRTHNLDKRSRFALRRSYAVYRSAAWQSGAESSAAGRGFSAQVDVAALFVERCVSLTRREGIVALILPSKLWRSLAGGGVRALLQGTTALVELADLTEGKQIFDAAVYPSLIVTRRLRVGTTSVASPVSVRVDRRDTVVEWQVDSPALPFDETPGSPWILLPPDVRVAFDRLASHGTPFAQSVIGRPMLGVKSGFNEAFIVPPATVESEMLRPLIRGEDVAAWCVPPTGEEIIWTHDAAGRALRSLPPRTLRWLSRSRAELEGRSDARGQGRWWSLFRTESADYSRPRVVWSDVARSPKAALLRAGDDSVAINSCYVARCPTLTDALTLAALLNSSVAAAWLNAVAEPARGGYHRYLGWTMSILPLPKDWSRACAILSPIALRAIEGSRPSGEELTHATLDAYGLSGNDICPLLEWAQQ